MTSQCADFSVTSDLKPAVTQGRRCVVEACPSAGNEMVTRVLEGEE